MAKIGLNNLKYSVMDSQEKYDGATSFGKVIDCKVSIEVNNAELYADDGIAETDYTFKKGTVSLTVDEDADTVFAKILGHTIDAESGELVRKDTDIAPYVALGRIITKLVNGSYKYKVEFLPKVKFAEPSQEESTKGESVEFKTNTIEGTVMKLSNGTWSKSKTFTDKSQAITYLDGLMAVSNSNS